MFSLLKIPLTLMILLLCSTVIAQTQILPFSNTVTYDQADAAISCHDMIIATKIPHVSKLYGFDSLATVDSSVITLQAFDLQTQAVKEYKVKYHEDTVVVPFYRKPLRSKGSDRVFFWGYLAKVPSDTSAAVFAYSKRAQVLISADTSLNDVHVVRLQYIASNFAYTNYNWLVNDDSSAYIVASDSLHHVLCKFSTINGQLLDTMTVPGGDGIALLNDSLMACGSFTGTYIVNVKNHTLVSSHPFTTSISLLYLGLVMSPRLVYYAKDKSWRYCARYNFNRYMQFSINKYGIYDSVGSIRIETVPPLSTPGISNAESPYMQAFTGDSIFYLTFKSLGPSPYYAICRVNTNGITEWINVYEVPNAIRSNATTVAMQDGSVVSLFSVVQDANGLDSSTVYYVHVDASDADIPLSNTMHVPKTTMQIYPNPSNNDIFIANINRSDIKQCTIMSTNGYTCKAPIQSNLSIDISALAVGSYVLQVELTNSETFSLKFVKQP
jgi:hypothetical protein